MTLKHKNRNNSSLLVIDPLLTQYNEVSMIRGVVLMLRNNKVVKILSIDGGGIRGIIPIVILQSLRQILKEKNTNEPLYQLFDLMSGSSTGGLISLALASPNPVTDEPMSLKELLYFYTKKSSYIFEGSKPKIYKAISSLFKAPINPTRYEEQLFKIFGNETLKDLLVDVYITSLNITNFQTVNFNRISSFDHNYDNFYLRDVARATSAEPTLFPPAQVQCLNKPLKYCLIDGGFYALNPSLNAYLYAKAKYPNASKFVILSLGTGTSPMDIDCKEAEHWGLIDWISPWHKIPAVQAFLRGQMSNTTDLLKYPDDVELYRLQPTLTDEEDSVADISQTNIENLEKVASRYAIKQKHQLEQISNYLTRSFPQSNMYQKKRA